MRQSILPTTLSITFSVLAVSAVTALSSVPAQAQYAHCVPGRGCIPTTQASYNACYTLARQRGWRDSDNARRGGLDRGLDRFIFQCLQGRIPR
jgi:hypothetical protein